MFAKYSDKQKCRGMARPYFHPKSATLLCEVQQDETSLPDEPDLCDLAATPVTTQPRRSEPFQAEFSLLGGRGRDVEFERPYRKLLFNVGVNFICVICHQANSRHIFSGIHHPNLVTCG